MKSERSRYIEVEGHSIHLLVSHNGHDKWLGLWTGICMTAEQFLPILLSTSDLPINVIVIDPPGHGLSDPWSDEFSEESVQSIWEAVAGHFEIQHAVVGGHSYGAMSALMGDTAVLPWVDGVVLLDGGYNMPSQVSDEELQKGLDDYVLGYKFESWDMFLVEERKHVQHWDELNEQVARSTMKERDGVISLRVDRESAMKAYLLCSHYSRLRVNRTDKKALLLLATLPTEFHEERKADAEALADRLTNMTILEVPDSGHDLLSDNREFVVESARDFVNSVYFG